jgi:hypothetical protein
MGKGRLEAFSDGVIAIIITIMVLEMKVPHGADLAAVSEGAPVFSAYVLSFVNVGIFWNNHHHMLHATGQIDGRVLWANLLLLFWLSLIPFVIRWIDEAGLMALPLRPMGSCSSWRGSPTRCSSALSSPATAAHPHSPRRSATIARATCPSHSTGHLFRSRSFSHGYRLRSTSLSR